MPASLFPNVSVFVHGGVNFEPYKARLLDSIGKHITVTGVYKPAMVIKGKRTAVLEVRSIDEKKP